MITRWFRRLTQVGMLALIAIVPAIAIWGVSATTQYSGSDMDYRYTPFGNRVSLWLSQWLGDPSHEAASAVVGGPVSLRLFGVEFTDPLMFSALFADMQIPTVSLTIGFFTVLVLHMALGRAFCGYLCPYGTLSRLVDRLRRPLKAKGWVLNLKPPTWFRWTLLVATIVAPFLGMGLGPIVLPYVGVSRLAHAIVFGGAGGALGAVSALLLSDILLWDHGVCRGVCPSGALQGLLGKNRLVHLVALRTAPCQKSCHECSNDCWLGLDPRKGDPGNDCDSCGRCITGCPTDRLRVVIRPGKIAKPIAIGATTLVLPAILGSCQPTFAPEIVSSQAPFSSPFQPVSEVARKSIFFEEINVDGIAFGAGIAESKNGPQGLRLYMEEEPGKPWTGPLSVKLQSASGSATLEFEGANAPPSTPKPTLYEASVNISDGTELLILDGPHEGIRMVLPIGLKRSGLFSWLWAPGVIGAAWAAGLLLKRYRK